MSKESTCDKVKRKYVEKDTYAYNPMSSYNINVLNNERFN